MELIKEEKRYWETVIGGLEKVNSDGDIIVPDVKPDVLKVLQIDARSVITDKGITTGGIYAQGRIYVNILYVADGCEDETGCINSVFDFRSKIDNPLITPQMKLKMSSDVSRIDFILLNSRKLSIKANVTLDYEVIAEREIKIPSGFGSNDGECIEKTVEIDAIGVEEECSFAVRDTLEIPAGKASVKEVIKTDVKVVEREIKILPEKAVIRGNLGVCVLYFTNDMSIDYCEGEIPFTEVFDVEGLSEDDFCSIDLKIGEINTDLSEDNDGDIRLINLECMAEMNLRARRNEEISYICDCYCPGKKTEINYSETELRCFVDSISKETNERNVITPDENIPQIGRIYNVVAEPEVTKCSVGNGGVTVSGRVKSYILYITNNPKCAVYTIKKDFSFEYFYQSENAKEGMDCQARVLIENLSYSLNSKGEIELKYTVLQEIRITKKENLKLICDAQTEEKSEDNDIVIYFLKKGDSLWSVGKRYGVKVGDIMEMNGLENDKVSEGQKLLIPLG